ncbi:MAG: hypothetical protein QXV17_06460 [Candidatus Micrarchaeaceae archaeon]
MRTYKKHVAFVTSAWRYLNTIDDMQRLRLKLEMLEKMRASTQPPQEIEEKIMLQLTKIQDYLKKRAGDSEMNTRFEVISKHEPVLTRIGSAIGVYESLMDDGEVTHEQALYAIRKLYNFDASDIINLLQSKYSFTTRAMRIKVKRIKWVDSHQNVDVGWFVNYIENSPCLRHTLEGVSVVRALK